MDLVEDRHEPRPCGGGTKGREQLRDAGGGGSREEEAETREEVALRRDEGVAMAETREEAAPRHITPEEGHVRRRSRHAGGGR